ncbi:MAG: hypothetical protein AAGE59_03740 [Cyanobacteria bacterium P01_F01_bin.86]
MLECFLCLLFDIRAEWAIYQLTRPTEYGSIAYEYEKNAYPLALADVWARNAETEAALRFLQKEDRQATETQGIDFYSGFVLKGQMRKYFEFGDLLEPEYRDRMYQVMDGLTQTDPLSREATSPRKFAEGSQDDCTTLVDCRNTDNLRAMRETSVYLMAEETGNEATRQLYQAHLERYVSTLLDIGMGEWDSPTYHGHTTAAYLNLYDFAQDPAVKQLAQDGLDWLFLNAALRYWRGSWVAPAKRVNGQGAKRFFWLYFGDALPPEKAEKDWIHALATTYQPPEAVFQIARREFAKPLEIRRTHPHYENWKPELYGPAFYETLYFGHTFQLGSLARGTGGDWQGFDLQVMHGAGTDTLIIGESAAHSIAQHRNLVIWSGRMAPQLTFPEGQVTTRQGVTFVETEQTWLAVHAWTQGFVLEVGEQLTHGSFEDFRAGVLARSRLTVSGNTIEYQGSQGKMVALRPQNDALPQVWRDGVLHDWTQHTDMGALCEVVRGQVTLAGCPSFVDLVASNSSPRIERPKLPVPILGILGLPFLELSEPVGSVGDRDSV